MNKNFNAHNGVRMDSTDNHNASNSRNDFEETLGEGLTLSYFDSLVSGHED
jgi:hypothetical protein